MTATKTATKRPANIEDRLKQRIVDGDRTDLDADLARAMETYKPLDIINDHLLDGMKKPPTGTGPAAAGASRLRKAARRPA